MNDLFLLLTLIFFLICSFSEKQIRYCCETFDIHEHEAWVRRWSKNSFYNNLPAEARSLGIPTDVNGNDDPVINDSIRQIADEIYNNNNIYEVFYSIPDNTKAENSGKFMDLGLQTFSGDANALQNIKYISVELRGMFRNLKNYFEVNLYLLDGTAKTKIEFDDPRIDNKIW